jgi:ornithine carbamoyltransferase
MKKSFLKCTDFSYAEAETIFARAAELKANRAIGHERPLKGQTWAMLFHKSSTRTRISFEAGIYELGGHPMILDPKSLQLGRGETLEDTAKVMSRYIHGIIIRTYEQQLLNDFAEAGDIPVINALTNQLHPCQIYADVFTLTEQWSGRAGDLSALKGRKLAFVGDCASNMAHSWILAAAIFGIELRLTGPDAYRPAAFVDNLLAEAGLSANHSFISDPVKAAEGVDVVYTDVWVSMGDEEERDQRLRDFAPWQVNAELMAKAKEGACFMHCLPAHEGEEVSAEVLRSPASIVYDQAENRLHMQKSIMCQLGQA